MRIRSTLVALALVAALTGCATQQAPEASTADRAFEAALAALDELGVQVTSSDRATGQIRGTRNGADVAVNVVKQADGRTRVQFDAKGAKGRERELPGRFVEAYEKQMDR